MPLPLKKINKKVTLTQSLTPTPAPTPTPKKNTYSKMSALEAINMSFFPSLKTNQEV